MSQVFDNLKAAYDRIADPANRSISDYAQNVDGLKISPLSENAVKFCSVGTLIRQLNGSQHATRRSASVLINRTLQSEEYELLSQACAEHGFQGATDMHDRAFEETFHKVWTYALVLAGAQ